MSLENRIQEIMDRAVSEKEVAGVNFLVLQDGREVVYAQSGLADREQNKPMQRDTIIRLYSQTKPITAAAAMILLERGVIDLFQNVSDFLPAYQNLIVEEQPGKLHGCYAPLTVNNLLNMTSGLSYPCETPSGLATGRLFDEAYERLHTDNEMSTRELADRLANCPLAFSPDSSWQYGTSADVLGAVIEAASGMSLAEFMKKELFEPLGMEDTDFYVPAGKQSRLAKVYETVSDREGTSLRLYTGNHLAINNDMNRMPAFQSGGAGLASTLDDYSKFAAMLMNKGCLNGKQILKPKTVEFMTCGELLTKQQNSFENWNGLQGFSYNHLMRICKNPGQAGMLVGEGEYGWDGWLGAYFANLPKERLTILMGTQKKDAGTIPLTRKLRNVVMSELF